MKQVQIVTTTMENGLVLRSIRTTCSESMAYAILSQVSEMRQPEQEVLVSISDIPSEVQ